MLIVSEIMVHFNMNLISLYLKIALYLHYQNESFKNQLFRTEHKAAFISTVKEAVTLMFAFY